MRVLLCTLFLLSLSLSTSAQTSDQRSRARKAYQLGQRRFDAGDYAGAQRSFEEAYNTLPNPVVLLSIAECLLRQEAWRQAEATLTSYLRDAPADAPARAEVEEQLRSLRALPGTLIIESSPSGATLSIDGSPTNKSTPARLTLAPGVHMIELEGPSGEYGTATFDLRFASELSLHVALEAPAPPMRVTHSAFSEPVASGEVASRATEARLGRMAWSFTGLALAAGLSVAVLGPIALHKDKLYEQEPTAATREQGLRFARSADVCIGVAAASAVAAAVLFGVRAAKREKTQRVAWPWRPALGFGARAVRLDARVRF